MTGMEMMLSAMRALFVLGGVALLLAAVLSNRKTLLLGGRVSAALLVVGGGTLYFSNLPYDHMPWVLHGLSLFFAHHMVTRGERLEVSREILLPVMALTFYAPFLGVLAWIAAESAAKLRWRALNAY